MTGEETTTDREALEETLRWEFWRPENGGQWPRIADAILASGWLAAHVADRVAQAEAERDRLRAGIEARAASLSDGEPVKWDLLALLAQPVTGATS